MKYRLETYYDQGRCLEAFYYDREKAIEACKHLSDSDEYEAVYLLDDETDVPVWYQREYQRQEHGTGYKITIERSADFDDDEIAWFTRMNPDHSMTGDTLTERFPDGSGHTLVIFTGPYTAYGMCRDCGDHYIIARYSRYDRIDKDTLEITKDVEDR